MHYRHVHSQFPKGQDKPKSSERTHLPNEGKFMLDRQAAGGLLLGRTAVAVNNVGRNTGRNIKAKIRRNQSFGSWDCLQAKGLGEIRGAAAEVKT